MNVLTVNAGSSSVRPATFAHEAVGLRACAAVRHDRSAASSAELLSAIVAQHLSAAPERVAHRVVHGGTTPTSTRWIDPAVEAEIACLAPLASLHNPVALGWVRACREVLGAAVAQVAVFDTAFHARLPAVAATYALPWPLCESHGLRRYGFHGLAHQEWTRWRELRPDLPDGGRAITNNDRDASAAELARLAEPKFDA